MKMFLDLKEVRQSAAVRFQNALKKEKEKRERLERAGQELLNRHKKPEEPKQGVAEATMMHRIGLTVADPNHPMVSKRKETIQKTVRMPGEDREKLLTVPSYRDWETDRKSTRLNSSHRL